MNGADYFSLFGLPEKIEISLPQLQKRFYALSKEIHPDFHTSSATADASEALSAQLNQAFITLKDRNKRLHYLCQKYLGDPTEAEKKGTPTELLMEVMTVQEALEDYRQTHSESAKQEIEDSKTRFQQVKDEIDADIATLSTRFDATEESELRIALLKAIRARLLKLTYLSALLTTIETVLNPSEF